MTQITTEKLESTLRRSRPVLIAIAIACLTVFSGICAIQIDYELNGRYNKVIFAVTGIIVIFICGFAAMKALQAPLSGRSKIIEEAREYLRKDFTSDKAVRLIYDKLSMAVNSADKTMLTLLLSDAYMYRGQADKALAVLDNIDRSRFAEYPVLGVFFYERIIGIYSDLQDNVSVLAAYKDAEPLTDSLALTDYQCCLSAVSIQAAEEKALGNYRTALDMLLMKTEFTGRPYIDSRGTYPLKQFLEGLELYRIAELYCACGDTEKAAEALDKGGPMLSPSPFYLEMANKLSERLGQEIN